MTKTFLNTFIIISLILLVRGGLIGQDIHFTQFDFSPITLNPAKTGDFHGTARISGVYRDQWRMVGSSGIFTTPAVSVDLPLFPGIGKRDWIAIGGVIYSDGASQAAIRTSSFTGALSYHISLDKNRKNVLTLGLSTGMLQKQVKDMNSFSFEDEILSGSPSRDLNTIEEKGKGQVDYNAGILFTSKMKNKSNMEIGVSVGHLSRPTVGITSGGGAGNARTPIGLTAHAIVNSFLSDQFSITPRAIARFIPETGNKNIAVQGLANFHLATETNMVFSVGAGYRLGDAVQVLGGINIKDLKIGVGYDLRTATLSNTGGAFEIAASYIVKIYKKPQVTPTVHCPRL